MDLLQSDRMKLEILKALHGEDELTINALRKEVGVSNFNSVKRACLFLETVGLVDIEAKAMGEREYMWVTLTERGQDVVAEI